MTGSDMLAVQSRCEVGWIVSESAGLVCPDFADVLVGCEAAKGFETLGEVVGVEEGFEVFSELPVALVVIPPDSRFLEGTVHALDLPVGPGMVRLSEAVLDAVLAANAVEHVQSVTSCRAHTPRGHIAELNAVVRQHRVDGVGHGFDQGLQEADGRLNADGLMQLGEG